MDSQILLKNIKEVFQNKNFSLFKVIEIFAENPKDRSMILEFFYELLGKRLIIYDQEKDNFHLRNIEVLF